MTSLKKIYFENHHCDSKLALQDSGFRTSSLIINVHLYCIKSHMEFSFGCEIIGNPKFDVQV